MCVCVFIRYTFARDTEACHGFSYGKDLNAQLVFGVRLLFGYELLVQLKNCHLFNESHFFRSSLDGRSYWSQFFLSPDLLDGAEMSGEASCIMASSRPSDSEPDSSQKNFM